MNLDSAFKPAAADKAAEFLQNAVAEALASAVPEEAKAVISHPLFSHFAAFAVLSKAATDCAEDEEFLRLVQSQLVSRTFEAVLGSVPKPFGPLPPWYQDLRSAEIQKVEDRDGGVHVFTTAGDDFELYEFEDCCERVEFEACNMQALTGQVAEFSDTTVEADDCSMVRTAKFTMATGQVVTLTWRIHEGCQGRRY